MTKRLLIVAHAPSDNTRALRDAVERGARSETGIEVKVVAPLQVRRDDVAFQTQRRGGVDGAVLSDRAFLLRFFSDNHIDDRVLLVNFGADLCRRSFAEPLLAPPPRSEWCVRWSSEEPIYGGSGTPQLFRNDTWVIPGESAMVLAPQPRQRRRRKAVRRRTA